jgi:hypothetical protein
MTLTRAPRLVRAVAAGLLAGPAHAVASDVNGFLEPAGRGAAVVSFTYESYDEFWMGTNKVSDPGLGRVRTNSTTFYTQYGLSDRVTLLANLPYVNTRGDGLAGFSESGLQDLSALLKVSLAARGASARSSVVLAGGIRTIASNYEANKPVDIGDGTVDGLLRLVFMLQAGSFYWSQQVGFDARGGEAPNGFPVYTEVGYTLGRATLSLLYNGYWADGGTDIGDPGFTFPGNQDETQRVGTKAYLRMGDNWGAVAHVFTTLSGRNSGDTTGVAAGLVVRY